MFIFLAPGGKREKNAFFFFLPCHFIFSVSLKNVYASLISQMRFVSCICISPRICFPHSIAYQSILIENDAINKSPLPSSALQPRQRHSQCRYWHTALAPRRSRDSLGQARVRAIGKECHREPGAVLLARQPHGRLQSDQYDAADRSRGVHLWKVAV